MSSRFYQKDGERCRLFARRTSDIMPAEHPGCLRVTLQPIERGMVAAEHGWDLGWFEPEAVESYHTYLVEHGWECTGSRLYPPGGPRKTPEEKLETRMAALRRMIAEGHGKGETSSTRFKIRQICEAAGLPVPAIAA